MTQKEKINKKNNKRKFESTISLANATKTQDESKIKKRKEKDFG
jgi:hypothetical protein